MKIITVINSKRCWGYDVNLINNGKEEMNKQAGDSGNAAALAMTWKARYSADRIVGDKKVMDIINHD